MDFIPVARPAMIGNEFTYVNDCLKSNWISSLGQYVEKFEIAFAKFSEVKFATTCSNGTVAIHLALLALDIGPGDEVIVPSFTYVASVNAITYCNAIPVFVDSDLDSWNLDPDKLEEAISPKTKAILVVHLYGNPCNMDAIMEIANNHGLKVIEDCAEVHGAKFNNNLVGTFGDISAYSFFGNKVITTGEGGMVVSNDEDLISKVKLLKDQGMDPNIRYWFPIIGYNYRMTNIQAAIGLAQLESFQKFYLKRKEINDYYYENLKDIKGIKFQESYPNSEPINWLYSILITNSAKISRDELMKALKKKGIDTRPFFHPVHLLPPYFNDKYKDKFINAELLGKSGVNLPTFFDLTKEELEYICTTIKSLLS